MDGNQPTTAREWLSIKRREEYELHTQDPTNGVDFDTLIKRTKKSINESMGLSDKHLGNRDCAKSRFVPNVNFDDYPTDSDNHNIDAPLSDENDHNHLMATLMRRSLESKD